MITRADVDTLIDVQVANELFEGAIRESKVLSTFRRLPNMTSDKTKLKVLETLPVAYFVDEKQNNGRKNITKLSWDNVFITAEELAVIIPIKENVLNDTSIDLWAEIKPRIVEAMARKIDNAVINGVDAPASWGKGLIPTIIDKAKEVTETGKLYSDINNVMVKVEESGYEVNTLMGGVGLKGKFRMMTDENGQPLNTTEIGSLKRVFVDNGTWNKENATLVAGDFSQAVYSVRQDITYKVLDQAVIQDPSSGEILYNLAQEDMVALRVVFRLGYAIPNPVNAEDESSTRYPFAYLKPGATEL